MSIRRLRENFHLPRPRPVLQVIYSQRHPPGLALLPPDEVREGEEFTEMMVLRGSLERLSPVLMTALTAIIGLVPLVIAGQKSGREILYPVATVIVGGLITSTLCEFLVHPGLFWRFSGHNAKRLTAEMEGD